MIPTTSVQAPIIVIGARYVGLITAVGFARYRQVRVVDIDTALISDVKNGRTPICEAGLKKRLDEVGGNLSFYTDLREALDDGRVRLIFVAVGTPTSTSSAYANGDLPADPDVDLPVDPEGDLPADPEHVNDGKAADLASIDTVLDVLLSYKGLAVVMKSTVPPRTGATVRKRAGEVDSDLIYISCPEFLREGEAIDGFDNPDRIVVGFEETSWATEELRELHAELHPGMEDDPPSPRYLQMDTTSAELVKHLSNLYLAARISFSNMAANLCEELDADVREVMAGVGADLRIGPRFLEPGMGFGGSCFGKDVLALWSVAEKANVDTSFPRVALSVNAAQPHRVIRKLERRFESLQGTRVAILGLTFKPNTDDLRGSPAFVFANALRELGATLRAWDPQPDACEQAVRNWHEGRRPEWMLPEEMASDPLNAMSGAHAVVLVTAWPEFEEIDWQEAADVMAGKLVVDGRNQLSPEAVRAAGLEYEGTGRESSGLHRPLLEGAAEG